MQAATLAGQVFRCCIVLAVVTEPGRPRPQMRSGGPTSSAWGRSLPFAPDGETARGCRSDQPIRLFPGRFLTHIFQKAPDFVHERLATVDDPQKLPARRIDGRGRPVGRPGSLPDRFRSRDGTRRPAIRRFDCVVGEHWGDCVRAARAWTLVALVRKRHGGRSAAPGKSDTRTAQCGFFAEFVRVSRTWRRCPTEMSVSAEGPTSLR